MQFVILITTATGFIHQPFFQFLYYCFTLMNKQLWWFWWFPLFYWFPGYNLTTASQFRCLQMIFKALCNCICINLYIINELHIWLMFTGNTSNLSSRSRKSILIKTHVGRCESPSPSLHFCSVHLPSKYFYKPSSVHEIPNIVGSHQPKPLSQGKYILI